MVVTPWSPQYNTCQSQSLRLMVGLDALTLESWADWTVMIETNEALYNITSSKMRGPVVLAVFVDTVLLAIEATLEWEFIIAGILNVRPMHPSLPRILLPQDHRCLMSWAMNQTAARCNDVNNGSVNQNHNEDSYILQDILIQNWINKKEVTYDGNQVESASYTMVQQEKWLAGRSSTSMTPSIDDLGMFFT